VILRAALAALILLDAAPGPPWLAEAVRAGSTPAKLEAYGVPGLAVTYTTPFLRVARTANAAVRAGKTFGVADVPMNAYAPELRVLIGVRAVTAGGKLIATASPKAVRLMMGAGEIKATRMDAGTAKQTVTVEGGSPAEVTGGILKAVFEIKGPPPRGGQLEILYESPGGAAKETIVERVPLDFQKTRW
jgi:hypothetical protein